MKPSFAHRVGTVVVVICTVALLVATVSAHATPLTAPAGIWTDDFSDGALSSRWSWIREDPTRWSLIARPGFLRITTQQAFSDVNNLLVQDAPAGDYQIETRVLFTPSENFQMAGLLIYQDDGSYLTLGRAFCNAPPPSCVNNGIYFDRVEGGNFVGGNYATTTSVQGDAYLKVVRQGAVYTGYVSTDGAIWTLLGAHAVTIAPTSIGLRASNQTQGASEIAADFDFFTVRDRVQRMYLPLLMKSATPQ